MNPDEHFELVLKLLQQHEGTIELFPKTLPPTLSPQLPLPDGRLIGSMVLEGDQGSLTLVYHLEAPPKVLFTQYGTQLMSNGWEEWPMFRSGGLAPSVLSLHRTYYLSAENLRLSLQAKRTGDGTDFYLNLMKAPAALVEHHPNLGFAPMPTLYPPEGLEHMGGGISGNAHASQSSASLVSPAKVLALLTHYEEQMELAGWQRLTRVSSEDIACSLWRLNIGGRAFQAVLAVIAHHAHPGKRQVHLVVYGREDDPGGDRLLASSGYGIS